MKKSEILNLGFSGIALFDTNAVSCFVKNKEFTKQILNKYIIQPDGSLHVPAYSPMVLYELCKDDYTLEKFCEIFSFFPSIVTHSYHDIIDEPDIDICLLAPLGIKSDNKTIKQNLEYLMQNAVKSNIKTIEDAINTAFNKTEKNKKHYQSYRLNPSLDKFLSDMKSSNKFYDIIFGILYYKTINNQKRILKRNDIVDALIAALSNHVETFISERDNISIMQTLQKKGIIKKDLNLIKVGDILLR